jgi:hypothetical protein
MLAQVAPSPLTPAIAWLVATIVLFVPGAQALKWLVDQARTLLPNDLPAILWPAIAVVVALVICLLWQVNVIAPAVKQVPALAGSTALAGVFGQIVTALGLAGMASYYHDRSK